MASERTTTSTIPSGSIAPPNEFQQKMSMLGGINSHNGMFAESVFTWDDLPCSLHFSDADPSDSAKVAMKVLHDHYLSATFGAKQGMYGAGGGGVHVLYLGSPPPPNKDETDAEEDHDTAVHAPPLDITTLLQMMRLAQEHAPPNMQWMTTVDPLHQQLFPKSTSAIDEDEESVVSFEAFVNLLQGEMAMIPTRNIIGSVPYPPHVLVNWPFLFNHPNPNTNTNNAGESGDDDEEEEEEGRHDVVFPRVLFLLPRFAKLHDGDCLRSNNNCPVATAFAEYERTFSETNTDETTTRRMHWWQYQNSPQAHHVHMNEGVMVQESDGMAKDVGDIMESPVVCLFQLESTGEVLALVQWDYRD